jgi:hypothetical protein
MFLVSVPYKKVGLETYTIQRQTLSHDGSLLFTKEANIHEYLRNIFKELLLRGARE